MQLVKFNNLLKNSLLMVNFLMNMIFFLMIKKVFDGGKILDDLILNLKINKKSNLSFFCYDSH